jgi:uncharacterized repeat protein (TIGR01451 family)
MHRYIRLVLILTIVGVWLGFPLGQAAAQAGILLTKTAGADNATLGDTIVYTYTISNTTTDNCFEAKLIDDKIGQITIPGQLEAGDNVTVTATHVVTSADFSGDATQLTNVATFTGSLSSGENVTVAASESVALNQTSSLQVGMSADVSSAYVGDNITYTYTITNNGQAALNTLALTDSRLGAVTLSSTTLASGASLTATRIYTVLSSDRPGPLSSSATATATSSTGAAATATSANVTVTLSQASSLQVTKLADKNVAAEGDVITYTYSVSNNGEVEIKDIVLTDDKLGSIPLVSGNTTVSSLVPGAQVTATATYKVVLADLRAGSIKNTAWATGTDVNGNAVKSGTVQVEVSTNGFLNWLTKAGILRASGVMGKGIDRAPGLQKPFNPNSQAAQHAGKKDGKGNQGQNENQTISGSTEQSLEGNSNQQINKGNQQNREQEMNGNQHQNGNHDKDKDKDKDKGKGQGKNNK